MKLITTLTTFLLLAFATAMPSPDVLTNDWANAGACALKSPAINTAIENFCSKTDMVVPSLWARNGKRFGNIKLHVSGSCTPAQWIPPQWCRAQFHAICAGTKNGFGTKRYGRNQCQKFQIAKRGVGVKKPGTKSY